MALNALSLAQAKLEHDNVMTCSFHMMRDLYLTSIFRIHTNAKLDSWFVPEIERCQALWEWFWHRHLGRLAFMRWPWHGPIGPCTSVMQRVWWKSQCAQMFLLLEVLVGFAQVPALQDFQDRRCEDVLKFDVSFLDLSWLVKELEKAPSGARQMSSMALLSVEEREKKVLKVIREAASSMHLDIQDDTPLMEAPPLILHFHTFSHKL